MLGSDTVTRLRGMIRVHGDWTGTDTGTIISGCSFQPLGGAEQTDRGELVVTNATLFAPADADIRATDRVQWRGDIYAVNGPPKTWNVPGSEHQEIGLKLVQGQG